MFGCDTLPGSIQRFGLYLHYLQAMDTSAASSATTRSIAHALNIRSDIVRKDIQSLFPDGKACEYDVVGLIRELERYVCRGKLRVAVLVGVGKLGKTLLSYAGFTAYDMDIIAGFDVDPHAIQTSHGKPVYPMARFAEMCAKLNARVGIITTTGGSAQAVCDQMIQVGIRAIWNFTSVSLIVPERILVVNADMSRTLLKLFQHALG